MGMNMPRMPEFETEEELAVWVDTHDTAAFLAEMEDAEETLVVKRTHFATQPLDVRLRTDLYAAIVAPPNGAEFPIRCSYRLGCVRR